MRGAAWVGSARPLARLCRRMASPFPPHHATGGDLSASHQGGRGDTTMRGVWLIAWRELRAYLLSPIAYGVTAVLLALSCFFFFQHLADYSIKSLQWQYPGTQELLTALHPNQHILQPLFDQMSILLLFVTPILTMRL